MTIKRTQKSVKELIPMLPVAWTDALYRGENIVAAAHGSLTLLDQCCWEEGAPNAGGTQHLLARQAR